MRLSPELIELFDTALNHSASDIHLVAGEIPRMRIHGELLPVPGIQPLSVEHIEAMMFPLFSPLTQTALETGKVSTMETLVTLYNFNFVTYLYSSAGYWTATIRIFPSSIPTLEIIAPECVTFFQELTQKASGLILITGPTGSGKQTTAFALLQEINKKQQRRIHLLEDSPSFRLRSENSLISSMYIGQDVPDFDTALRQLQRGADPDVIYLSDLPTTETLQTVLSLARTGHLIIVNAAASTASKALATIAQALPDSVLPMLTEQLVAVVNQRLFRRKERPGRVPAYEILKASRAVRTAIHLRADAQVFQTIIESEEDGMRALPSVVEKMVIAEEITEESQTAALLDYL